MRVLRLLLSGLLAAGTLAAVAAPALAAGEHYYLALGDSLSRGYMPGPGDTSQGYVDDLYATLHAKDPSLELVKLGCSGETTGTMINGGHCNDGRYSTGSQLGDAVKFLTEHGADVKYLTLDIGANDVDGCLPNGTPDAACLLTGITTITTNLNTILTALKKADGGLPQSVGMTYYDPFLASWLTGVQGQVVATASVALAVAVNTAETLLYTLYGFKIADVATAFHTLDFTSPTLLGTPVNVQTICNLTYMCSLKNIHANVAGYQVIAQTFAGQLT